jgi:hypothetical protein
MTATISNLRANLARNAPWLIEGGSNIYPEPLQGSSSELLAGIRDNRLTIITDSGQVYEQYQTLEIVKGKIKIEKPYGWKESTKSFHVFFKNRNGNWNFFAAKTTECYPLTLLIQSPKKVFALQKRRYQRILAPIGTKALFKGDRNRIDSAHVHDISESGMLICVNSGRDRYMDDSIINEIFITIPPKIKKDQDNIARRITPLISNGKVVRNFYDQEHSISYYGVSFLYSSGYVKESVSRLVTYLESLIHKPYFARSVSWPSRENSICP